MKQLRLPPVWYYFAVLLFVALVVIVAMQLSVQSAAFVLAGGFAIYALLLVVLPHGILPEVRSVKVDVVTCCAIAILLVYFASWGNTPQI